MPLGSTALPMERDRHHVRTLLIGLFMIASAFFLDFARDFLLPFVIAFFLALTFRPAVRGLTRFGLPAWVGAVGFMAAVLCAGVGAAYAVVKPVQEWIANAPAYAATFSERLQQFRGSFRTLLQLGERLQSVAQPATDMPAREVVVSESQLYAYLSQATGYSLGIMTTIAVSLIMAAFLMASGDLFYAKLVRVLPTLRDKKTALRIVYDVEREVSAYLLSVTAINAGLGIVIAITFHFLGMPTPFLFGALAFAFNFVPYIGAIAGMAISLFMAVVTFDTLGHALVVPLAYAFWTSIEGQLITPMVLGRRLQLNSVAILIALAFWTWLWGVAGAVVAVPILVTIKVFADHLDSLSALGEFLSEKYPDDGPASSQGITSQMPSSAVATTLIKSSAENGL